MESTVIPELEIAETPKPTEGAQATEAETPGMDRYVDMSDVEQFEMLRDLAMQNAPVFGPASETLVEGVGTVQGIFPDISTTNSYFRAVFTNPDDLDTPFDVGFGLRHVEGNNQIRLIVSSTDEWRLAVGDGNTYQSGKAYGFQSESGEQNLLEVVVNGETGYLAVNGIVVAVLDLSPSLAPGDIWVAAGLNASEIVAGRASTVTDFQIWVLPNS